MMGYALLTHPTPAFTRGLLLGPVPACETRLDHLRVVMTFKLPKIELMRDGDSWLVKPALRQILIDRISNSWCTACTLLSNQCFVGCMKCTTVNINEPRTLTLVLRAWQGEFFGAGHLQSQRVSRRAVFNLNALAITETELKLIAAAAIMGLRSNPKKG